MELILTERETDQLNFFGYVEVVRDNEVYIVERKHSSDGFIITAKCKYTSVKLYEKEDA